jgi:hypothetical protein
LKYNNNNLGTVLRNRGESTSGNKAVLVDKILKILNIEVDETNSNSLAE